MGINICREQVPAVTELLHFWHLLEENHLGEARYTAINAALKPNGSIMHGGTILGATIVNVHQFDEKQREGKRSRDAAYHE